MVSTVVGVVDRVTGQTATGVKVPGDRACIGMCAETIARNNLMKLVGDRSKPRNFIYSAAVRPRTQEDVPVCVGCQSWTNDDQYPPGRRFDDW